MRTPICQKKGCGKDGTKKIIFIETRGTMGYSSTIFACPEHEKEYQQKLKKKDENSTFFKIVSGVFAVMFAVLVFLPTSEVLGPLRYFAAAVAAAGAIFIYKYGREKL